MMKTNLVITFLFFKQCLVLILSFDLIPYAEHRIELQKKENFNTGYQKKPLENTGKHYTKITRQEFSIISFLESKTAQEIYQAFLFEMIRIRPIEQACSAQKSHL